MKKLTFLIMTIVLCTTFCAEAKGKKILYIGDSVTDGNWGKVGGGPNRSLTDMNHIFGHGYMFICAAHYMAAYPQEGYAFYNRGISGNRIADLKARWEKDALGINPDILSVLVGVNDLLDAYNSKNGTQEVDTTAFEADYRDILNRSLEQNPHLQLVLGEPFIASVGMWEAEWPHWRENCDRLGAIVRKLAKEYHAVCLPYQEMFDQLVREAPDAAYWIWDGTHPSPAGHQKMAELWIKTAGKRL